jgi:polyisoprenoid-binding protein YceI
MRTLSLIAASLLVLAATGRAEVYNVDKAHSEVGFSVRHMGVSKVSGRFNDVSGTIDGDPKKPETAKVDFVIKTASIDTNQANRDKHLRGTDFFDVEKFPEITFKSSKIAAKGAGKYDVTGTLTMHGVSKEVTLPVTMAGPISDGRGGQKVGFETETTLNRKDYGITWNTVLDTGGVAVSDEVKVSISFEANQAKPEAAK